MRTWGFVAVNDFEKSPDDLEWVGIELIHHAS